jgi:hypothetical protein
LTFNKKERLWFINLSDSRRGRCFRDIVPEDDTLEDLHNAILIPLDLMAWLASFTLVMKLGTKKKRFHF